MSPAEELHAAAADLRLAAAKALEDLLSSEYYAHDPATFAQGIDNAVGGDAGLLAAMFNPAVAEALADTFVAAAEIWPRGVHATTASVTASRKAVLGLARLINGRAVVSSARRTEP